MKPSVKSNRAYSPQNYLYAVTGKCYILSLGLPIQRQIEQILTQHPIPSDSYSLIETLDALHSGVPMVLVDCSDYLEDDDTGELQPIAALRWFRVPETFTDK